MLLDQEGLEIDELDRMEKDTPLHKAVRYVNGLSQQEWQEGKEIVEILIDAGCDPRYGNLLRTYVWRSNEYRIRNKANLKPIELVDPRNEELRLVLRKAENNLMIGNDDIVQDDDDGPGGSGSESD